MSGFDVVLSTAQTVSICEVEYKLLSHLKRQLEHINSFWRSFNGTCTEQAIISFELLYSSVILASELIFTSAANNNKRHFS